MEYHTAYQRSLRGKDLRKGRNSQTGQIYLVTSVTHHRARLFTDFNLARIVVNAFRHHHEKGNVESLAYTVMPDHFHWLFALGEGTTLATVMRSVKSYSANCIRQELRKRQTICPERIWQEGYHDHALRREEDLREAARYLVANPLRAGLVGDIREYPLWDAIWL